MTEIKHFVLEDFDPQAGTDIEDRLDQLDYPHLPWLKCIDSCSMWVAGLNVEVELFFRVALTSG